MKNEFPSRLGTRICVLGTSGSGKTTLAKALAERLELRHIELDAIHHLPGWKVRELDDFRAEIANAIEGDRWVADGNYSKAWDLTVAAADTLIWLDFPLVVPLWRVSRRSLTRGIRGEELWHGNRESLRIFFSRESLAIWVLKTHRRRNRQAAELFASAETEGHVKVRLRNPRDVDRLLDGLARP